MKLAIFSTLVATVAAFTSPSQNVVSTLETNTMTTVMMAVHGGEDKDRKHERPALLCSDHCRSMRYRTSISHVPIYCCHRLPPKQSSLVGIGITLISTVTGFTTASATTHGRFC